MPTSLALISIPLSKSKLGLMGGFSFMKLLVMLRALNKPASAAISFSLTSVRGAGTRRSFLGGEDVATVERECVGEGERVEEG
jgi:hypothetical protein